MNIVQLHDRVRFWIDSVSSARFESDDIDQAINNATIEVVDEKYDHSKPNHKKEALQKTQRLRDELSDLIKYNDTDTDLTLTQNSDHVLIPLASFPADYKYLLAIALYVGDTKYDVDPITYNRKHVVSKNPFRKIRSGLFTQLYYNESELGIRIDHPFAQTAPTKVEIDYLSKPVDVFYGYEKTYTDTIGLNTPFITAYSPTSYKSTEYVSGTSLTTDGVSSRIDYGIAVVDFVDPNINGFLHEEIAKRAAANCLLTAGNYDKYKTLKAETLAI
jgi:hypothetical protein